MSGTTDTTHTGDFSDLSGESFLMAEGMTEYDDLEDGLCRQPEAQVPLSDILLCT